MALSQTPTRASSGPGSAAATGRTVTGLQGLQNPGQDHQGDSESQSDSPFRIPDGHVKILEELWGRGLTNTKSEAAKELLREANQKTGLRKKQVQNWIKNRNNKKNRVAGHHCRTKRFNLQSELKLKEGKKPTETQLLYRAHQKKYLTGKEQDSNATRSHLFTGMKDEWNGKRNQVAYISTLRTSMEESVEEDTLPPRTDSQRKAVVRAVTLEVTKLCKYLKEELGYESLFIASHPGDGEACTGTDVGIAHITEDKKRVIVNFQYAVGGKENIGTCDTRADLLKKVQDIYNEKYEEQTGRKHVQYKAIEEGRIKLHVQGLPVGVGFSKPAYYNDGILKLIIANKGNLGFQVVTDGSITGVNTLNSTADNSGDNHMAAINNGAMHETEENEDGGHLAPVVTDGSITGVNALNSTADNSGDNHMAVVNNETMQETEDNEDGGHLAPAINNGAMHETEDNEDGGHLAPGSSTTTTILTFKDLVKQGGVVAVFDNIGKNLTSGPSINLEKVNPMYVDSMLKCKQKKKASNSRKKQMASNNRKKTRTSINKEKGTINSQKK